MILAQDYKVYSHFKAKFQTQLESFGYDQMVEEMKELRRANEAVMKKCEFSAADNNKIKGVNKWWGPANLVGYLVNIFHVSTTDTVLQSYSFQGGGPRGRGV